MNRNDHSNRRTRTHAVIRRALAILLVIFACTGNLFANEIRSDISYRLRTPAGLGKSIRDLALVPGDSNSWILLRSDRPMAVFQGSDLWFSDRMQIRISIDSLKLINPVLPVLRIVAPETAEIGVWLIRQRSETDTYFDLRPRSAKEEFATFGMLLVIMLMLLLLATNRRTVTGFFSFSSIFSWITRDDPMATARMTATPNLAYYGILVLWLALLGTLHQVAAGNPTFSEIFTRYSANVLFLLLLLFARLIILTGFPGLFGMRFGNGQQFGLVRVSTLLAVLSCAVVLVSFMLGSRYTLVYSLVSGLWLVGLGIYFVSVLVLMVRTAPTRALHYFSYLCLSEIIPLLLFSGLLHSQANPDLR